MVGAFPDEQSCLNLAAARLRHIAGSQWSTRKYMNMARGLAPYAVTDAVCRGRGAGKAVMTFAIEEAWKAGCYKVMLMTGTQRDGTVAFYESLGFRSDKKTAMDLRRPG